MCERDLFLQEAKGIISQGLPDLEKCNQLISEQVAILAKDINEVITKNSRYPGKEE